MRFEGKLIHVKIFVQILHGEQYLELHQKPPTEGQVENRVIVQDVLDKGSGAVVLVQS